LEYVDEKFFKLDNATEKFKKELGEMIKYLLRKQSLLNPNRNNKMKTKKYNTVKIVLKFNRQL
jgi:hypothetical protein